MTRSIQTTGTADFKTDEFSFTICENNIAITFDGLTREDVEEMISCLSCMLMTEEDLDIGLSE